MKSLLLACLQAEWAELRRYWFNTLAALGVSAALFAMLFFGVRAFGSPQADLSALVVGYYAFSLTNVAFQRLASFLMVEAQVGTLEQLALSPFGLGRVALARMLTYLVSVVAFATVALVITMAIAGLWLRFHLVGFAVMTLLLVGQAYAFGLAMGGLALLFKRVGDLMQLVSLALVVLILVPAEGGGVFCAVGAGVAVAARMVASRGLAQPSLLAVEVAKTFALLAMGVWCTGCVSVKRVSGGVRTVCVKGWLGCAGWFL